MKSRNCLSYWFPLVEAAGVPVPKTRIVQAPPGGLATLLEGLTPEGWEDFIALLKAAVVDVGGPPCFLRTGLTSGKHEWDRTCNLRDLDKIGHNVGQLVEFSECADFLGLRHDVWVARELIQTAPLFHAFRGFPVTREFRVFVENGKTACIHPYWPMEAVAQGRPTDPEWQAKLALASDLAGDVDVVRGLAERAGAVLPGAWSIDILQDASGKWLVTDCADAGCSFHWDGCANGGRWKRMEFDT